MKLTIEQLSSALCGVVSMNEEPDGTGIALHRFTAAQEEVYSSTTLSAKCYASSGIRLSFRTDSDRLTLRGNASAASSRSFYTFDLVINGKLSESFSNVDPSSLPKELCASYPLGDFSKTFLLGPGEKSVSLYFPFSVKIVLTELSLSDGASFIPERPKKKLLLYGDSITQGYDTMHPSQHFGALLAEALGAELINKGIGAEIFRPALAACPDPYRPDFIVSAYGTNNWRHDASPDVTRESCNAYYQALATSYPGVPIYALTPLMRLDRYDNAWDFHLITEMIRSCAEMLENVTMIDTYPFLPADPSYFSDLRLHPNDKGFALYAKELIKSLKNK